MRPSSKDGAGRQLDARRFWVAATATNAGGGVATLGCWSPWTAILWPFACNFSRDFRRVRYSVIESWCPVASKNFDLSWLLVQGPLQTGSARNSTYYVICKGLSGRKSCPPCASLQVKSEIQLDPLKEPNMAALMVHLLETPWDNNMECITLSGKEIVSYKYD